MDNSGMTTAMMCPRMGAYANSLKRKPASPSAALIFGGAIHEALEVRYRIHHDQPTVTDTCFDDMVTALMDHFELEGGDLDVQEYRNVSYGIRTLAEYVKKYRYEQPNTHYINGPNNREPCVEIPFCLPVGQFEINKEIWVTDPDINNGNPTVKHINTITIFLTGKIDMIVKKGASLYILDHKTSSMGGNSFFDEFYTSTQFKGYKWAAQQITGQPISGVIINALFCRRPKADGSVNYEFIRQTIPIHDDHINEWQNTFLTTVSGMIQHHIDQENFASPEQSFPMNTPWCKGKYGKCKFYDVCTLRPHQRDQMLYSNLFEDDTWSPIKEEARINLGNEAIILPELPNVFPLS